MAMDVVLVFYECRSPLACFLPWGALSPQSILLRQIATHLALHGLLRSGQSVVVLPGVIVTKENGIYFSTPGLLVSAFDFHLEVGQELLGIQKKK